MKQDFKKWLAWWINTKAWSVSAQPSDWADGEHPDACVHVNVVFDVDKLAADLDALVNKMGPIHEFPAQPWTRVKEIKVEE